MKKHFFVPAAALFLFSCLCCDAAEGIVTASMLNARVFPELKSPAVIKLPRGKKVDIFKLHGVWLEIAAPDITPVFASAALLDGKVALRDMNLRIRPYGQAAVIGRIKKGTVLKAVSEPDRYGWVQVAPLPDMRLYVMRDYVKFDASQVPVAENRPAPAPAPAAEKKVEKKAELKAAPLPAPDPAPAAAFAAEKKVEKKAEKKAEVKPAPAPAPAPAAEKKVEKKAEKKAEVKPAPAPAPAPAAEKKVEKKAEKKAEVKPAPAPAPAAEKKVEKKAEVKFDLLPARKRELINIGTDISKNTPYKKSGRLVAVPKPSGNCTTYALIDKESERPQGFIFAEEGIDLKSLVGKEIEVTGFAYKVSGWSNPVVCAVKVKTRGE